MKFVDKLLGFLQSLGNLFKEGFTKLIEGINVLIEWISKPLSLLFMFFDGIFYFISKLFQVVVELIMILVAMFQFLFALIAGVFRTIANWLTVVPSASDVSFPSVSSRGFAVVVDLLQPTGLMTVVPMLSLAFIWFFFVIKMIGLFGGSIYISPFGRGGDK